MKNHIGLVIIIIFLIISCSSSNINRKPSAENDEDCTILREYPDLDAKNLPSTSSDVLKNIWNSLIEYKMLSEKENEYSDAYIISYMQQLLIMCKSTYLTR